MKKIFANASMVFCVSMAIIPMMAIISRMATGNQDTRMLVVSLMVPFLASLSYAFTAVLVRLVSAK